MNLEQVPVGRGTVELNRLRLWDYMGLFFLGKGTAARREFCRFPKLVPVDVAVSGRTWSFRTEGDVFSDSRPGRRFCLRSAGLPPSDGQDTGTMDEVFSHSAALGSQPFANGLLPHFCLC